MLNNKIIIDEFAHLGDNIINFIFFHQIKHYIENNNITIYYYCYKQYHNNLNDFNCSNNILILDLESPDYDRSGYILWQGHNTPHRDSIEDKLCAMFNNFLNHYKIPIQVNIFEYQDPDLLFRFNNLDNLYKNIDILIINSKPLSSQYCYNKNDWDNFISKIRKEFNVATTEKVNDSIISLNNMSVKNIAAIALNVKYIIAINTGPSIPLYNTDILNNVKQIFIFGGDYFKKTRKVKPIHNFSELSFLL